MRHCFVLVVPDDAPNVGESAFAPYVGFGVLMTSKLGTNEILMRYIAALVP